jgi:SAM-dependent methyltransferase
MNRTTDLYGAYGHFEADVMTRVRARTYGEDIGQNSWTTADEYRRWAVLLGLQPGAHALEVASGSGGPAIFLAALADCRVTGIDVNADGVETANRRAQAVELAGQAVFRRVDADQPLPFPGETFDALLCVDSANHFAHRLEVLKDWRRVLKPGARALFTDPVVVTGLVTNEELAARSSIGSFLFAPPGVNERLIEEAGLELVEREDITESEAAIARRWHDARAAEREALVAIEGDERFLGLQRFFATVHLLTSERRLSRIAYLLRKPAGERSKP